MKKLLIGIPAFNEREMIGKVVKSLPDVISGIDRIDILVVDDGSSDGTGTVAQAKGATVVTHVLNLGLGGALKTIFTFAGKYSYDFLVTFDADGQHKAEDISRLLRPLLNNSADAVIGSRWKTVRPAPLPRILVNKLANALALLFFAARTTDSQSGLRAFNKKAIHAIRINTDGMEVSSEIIKEIARLQLRYSEIAIEPIYTQYSQTKGQKLSNAPSVLFELFMRFLRQ